MDGRAKRALIKRFVYEEKLKQKSVWGREMKLAGQLIEQYPDAHFWMDELKISVWLPSLAAFKTARGAADLEAQWRHYQADRAQMAAIEAAQPSLDISPNPAIMDEKPRRKQNALEWADTILSCDPPLN